MTLPTAAALLYFVWLDGNSVSRWAYLFSKALQFSLPVVSLAVFGLWQFPPAESPRSGRTRGWLPGLLSGLAIAIVTVAAYSALDRAVDLSSKIREPIVGKIGDFGVDNAAAYIVMAVLLSFVHSALEEYFWRWYVHAQLLRHRGTLASRLLSSAAFTAHHVVVLGVFLDPERAWSLLLLGSLAVFFGGYLWAALFDRSGSVLGAWISHVFADLAIMAVGYQLIWR